MTSGTLRVHEDYNWLGTQVCRSVRNLYAGSSKAAQNTVAILAPHFPSPAVSFGQVDIVGGANSNKFYRGQVVLDGNQSGFSWTRWGRTGDPFRGSTQNLDGRSLPAFHCFSLQVPNIIYNLVANHAHASKLYSACLV